MKKNLLFLATATTLAFAACNTGTNSDDGKLTPAQADSIANVKVDSAKAAMKNENDSAMTAKANAEARSADSLRVIDSIIAATKQTTTTKTVVVKKPSSHGHKGSTTSTTTTTTEPAPPPETIGNGKPKMTGQSTPQSGDNGTIGNGKPKM